MFSSPAAVTDSLPKDTINISGNFIKSLDSIHRIWYVERALHIDHKVISKYQQPEPKISDKEINRKSAALKTIIKIAANDRVKKYIQFYLSDKKRQTEILMGLYKHYFPLLDAGLKKYNLPDELKYLPVAESSLFNFGKSESGAIGIWQLKFAPAKHYGLTINSYIDERKDFRKSSVAAFAYLADLNRIYNDWLLTIAAYNSSPATVNKAVRRAKGKMDFWSIYNYLPPDDRDCVSAFLALIYVMNYYKDYNIKPLEIDYPVEADTVSVYKLLHLRQVSKVMQLPMKQLIEMNPVYTKLIIPENPKGNDLVVPCGYADRFYKLKDSIYHYRDSTINFYLKLTKSDYYNSKDDNVKATTEIYYIVKSNDNLSKVAKYYGVTTSELKKWNHLNSKSIRKGQKLKIIFNTGNDNKPQKPTSKTPNSALPAPNSALPTPSTYKVKPGDSFSKIAKSFGLKTKELLEINNFDEDHIIKPGETIRLKKE